MLVFSNPFGNGPSGKAQAVAHEIRQHYPEVEIELCGSSLFQALADDAFTYRSVDERSEEALETFLSSYSQEDIIVFSSQNRFVVAVAKRLGIKTAFLDGLAWFWREIPEDHFAADVIFWIKYPGIEKKIPEKYKEKIILISGFGSSSAGQIMNAEKNVTILYIGGCIQPLAGFPVKYVSLLGYLLSSYISSRSIEGQRLPFVIYTDPITQEFLSQNFPSLIKHVHSVTHIAFLRALDSCKHFITNGGQTAYMEAASLAIPVSFYLPLNLSQKALSDIVFGLSTEAHRLDWGTYLDQPTDFDTYPEKDAILAIEQFSNIVNEDEDLKKELYADFQKLLEIPAFSPQLPLHQQLGTTGAAEITKILLK